MAGLEPATEVILQISGRAHKPPCHRRLLATHNYNGMLKTLIKPFLRNHARPEICRDLSISGFEHHHLRLGLAEGMKALDYLVVDR
ncbi:hypothetical protein PoB_004842200 [Plakobranchus ocellatus]|uniref:Uncharacterized protein n=1 Tax=Plakobranchus ocellatus TaxID=259542 RepID=A0AAV4BSG3_9GAST|nr:hypothetical protein PoB_004842200 [Plakobranchus ocellatus]